MLGLVQECASNHIVALRGRSEQYFAADPELAKLDLIFVLTRMQIRMERYPRWCAAQYSTGDMQSPRHVTKPLEHFLQYSRVVARGSSRAVLSTGKRTLCRGDVVQVQTYFQQEGRVGARRDWILTNVATGEQYGCATSSWVMVNFKSRRLSKMPDAIKQDYQQLMPDPPKSCFIAAETRLKLPAAESITSWSEHVAAQVHMDMNAHVNNTAYLTWILASLPADLQENHVLAQYEVDYKAEGQLGAAPCHTASRLHYGWESAKSLPTRCLLMFPA